jgi:hypothetical protein
MASDDLLVLVSKKQVALSRQSRLKYQVRVNALFDNRLV